MSEATGAEHSKHSLWPAILHTKVSGPTISFKPVVLIGFGIQKREILLNSYVIFTLLQLIGPLFSTVEKETSTNYAMGDRRGTYQTCVCLGKKCLLNDGHLF